MSDSKFKLKLQEPCQENWNNMMPAGQGRFCQACAKVVVDFTQMTDHEVIQFFEASKSQNQSICGRVNKVQLEKIYDRPKRPTTELPLNSYRLATANWQKFLWMLVACFGSLFLDACQSHTAGKVEETVVVVQPKPMKKSPEIVKGKVKIEKPEVNIKKRKVRSVNIEQVIYPEEMQQVQGGIEPDYIVEPIAVPVKKDSSNMEKK